MDGRPERRGANVGLTALMVGLGIFLAVLGWASWGLYRRAAGFLDRPSSILSLPKRETATPSVMAAPAMIQRLRSASELTTAIHQLQTVVTVSQDRQVGDFTVGSTELLYVAIGEVRAGIDLAELDASSFTQEGGRLVVRLPAPRILDKKIDVEKSYVYDLRRSLFGPLDPTLQSQAEKAALDQIWRAACEGGLMARANERAALTVETLLADTGHAEVRAIARPAAAGECP